VTVIPPGGGEIIGDTPERRVEILSDDPSINATFSRFGAGQAGASLHVHREHSDLFYVLEGELTVRLGAEDRQVAVPAGSVARVPPNVVHGFRNASDADVRYLNFHVPGQRFTNYMRGLRDGVKFAYDQFDPPQDGGVPASAAAVGEPVVDIEALRLEERWGEQDEDVHTHDFVSSLYVLEGDVLLSLDGERHTLSPGTFAQVPAGVPHALSFPERARFLSLRTPNR
jgi:quercetin dioxygenase-like cupin family protein